MVDQRRLLLLLMFVAVLVGCQQTSPQTIEPTPTPFACQEPGTVIPGSLAETSRGYAYAFQIYLPPCYDSQSEQTYPVLYLLPGRGGGPGNWFAAGVAETADELILSGEVPPFLIVATESTETDPQGEIIENELRPYITSQYRVRTGRPYTAVAGGSLGGIGAYRLGLQHPDQFGSVGMFGSGLISGEEPALQEWLAALPPEQKPRFFLNSGEQDPLMLERAQAMATLLETAGIDTTMVVSPGEHEYSYWVSNMPAFLHWLANGWQE